MRKPSYAPLVLILAAAGCGGSGHSDSGGSTSALQPISFADVPATPDPATFNATTTNLTDPTVTYTANGTAFIVNAVVSNGVVPGLTPSRTVSITIDPSTAVKGVVTLGGGSTNSAYYSQSDGIVDSRNWTATGGTITIVQNTATRVRLHLDELKMEPGTGLITQPKGSFTISGDVAKNK